MAGTRRSRLCVFCRVTAGGSALRLRSWWCWWWDLGGRQREFSGSGHGGLLMDPCCRLGWVGEQMEGVRLLTDGDQSAFGKVSPMFLLDRSCRGEAALRKDCCAAPNTIISLRNSNSSLEFGSRLWPELRTWRSVRLCVPQTKSSLGIPGRIPRSHVSRSAGHRHLLALSLLTMCPCFLFAVYSALV